MTPERLRALMHVISAPRSDVRATPVQHRVGAKCRPLALESVGVDQARLAAESQALEQMPNRNVPIVGLSKDSMHASLLEQVRDHGRERLGRQALALV